MLNKYVTITQLMKKTLVIALAVFTALSSGFAFSCQGVSSGPMESITVAYSPFESTALFWVALDQQYFSRNGLKVTVQKYDSGAASLTGVLNGEADILVGLTEFPAVRAAFQKAPMAILGIADRGEFIYLIGRKDRNIDGVSDLKGKRVGVAFGTIAQFYLGRLVELNGLNLQDLTLVDLKTPEEWVNAVVDGDVDAVVNAQPDADTAKERLGDNAFFWPAQSGQFLNMLIVSTDGWVTDHPETVKKFLKSQLDAEDYLIRNPAAAKNIVQKSLNLDAGYMDTVWSQNQFSLSLDQSLIIAMEDEARWLIENNLTTEKSVPDFIDYIYTDALRAVKPHAVNIIE